MVNAQDLPYYMQLIFSFGHLRPLKDEPPHCIQFCYAAGLETSRVVENESGIASKDHLIFNVVHTTLGGGISYS